MTEQPSSATNVTRVTRLTTTLMVSFRLKTITTTSNYLYEIIITLKSIDTISINKSVTTP